LGFLRKTQLESDESAAQRIQRTLQPGVIEQRPGYQLEAFYRPFRAVSGDYFDVIDVSENQTLFAMADVSGKGIAAALLASNIQALVRSIAVSEADVAALARRINQHLSRYTPSDRFATAVFLLLSRDSGEISHVNAGHNPPLLCGTRCVNFMATALPLGLFPTSTYDKHVATLAPGDTLLLYTDGLTDSVSGESPLELLRTAVTTDDPHKSLSNLKDLIDPKLNEDDITVLLAKRVIASSAEEREM
jgi:sigma-B regulation protein RsbU (phosphoserine phosphatase)